jgi:hypothetical protein
VVLASGAAHAGPGGERHLNTVVIENARPGTAAWYGTPATPHAIEGYSSEVSVAPGETVHFHVSTQPAARYRIEIFRLGWYRGLGGRRVACWPGCARDEQGATASMPPQPNSANIGSPVRADWPTTDAVRVRRTWTSGYYEAWFGLTTGDLAGRGSATFFVVRAPPARHAQILVQVPVNTWQAYNHWGGRSLYSEPKQPAGWRVSFDRPYAGGVDAAFRGDQAPLSVEIQLVHFLERSGYDVAYQTDLDTDRDPSSLLRHRLVMTAGHDEYWTKTIRDAFDAARDRGVNLAFMGANVGFWQMRYEDGGRTIVEYRNAQLDPESDPALKTVQFRRLVPPRPECELRGVDWWKGLGAAHDYAPVAASLNDRWFAGTGFTATSTLPGLVGYEWDFVEPGCNVPTPTVLFHYEGKPTNADAVRYQASSGAIVFSAGTLQFSWGLDSFGGHQADSRLQRFMRNALRDLVHRLAKSNGSRNRRSHQR